MLSGPACEFLSSLQLGVRESFLEKVVSELGHGGLTRRLCKEGIPVNETSRHRR